MQLQKLVLLGNSCQMLYKISPLVPEILPAHNTPPQKKKKMTLNYKHKRQNEKLEHRLPVTSRRINKNSRMQKTEIPGRRGFSNGDLCSCPCSQQAQSAMHSSSHTYMHTRSCVCFSVSFSLFTLQHPTRSQYTECDDEIRVWTVRNPNY